jgi:hypothetical protein
MVRDKTADDLLGNLPGHRLYFGIRPVRQWVLNGDYRVLLHVQGAGPRLRGNAKP